MTHLVTVIGGTRATIGLSDLEPYMLDAPAPHPHEAQRRAPADDVLMGTTPKGATPGVVRPGDAYNASTDAGMLLERHGWTLHHTDRNGDRQYTRPGKDARDGSSATVYAANGTVCVWTDATQLEQKRWYDPFGLHVELDHGGDFRAATEALRGDGFGSTSAASRDVVAVPDEPVHAGLEAFYVDWPALWANDTTGEDWLVRPFIARGRAHALYAGAKTGKSYITLEVVAAIACGRPIMQQPAGRPVHVLYVDYEMTAADLRERLDELGYDADVDLSYLHYALLPSVNGLDTPEGGHTVLQAALACGAELVVFDTTARAVEGEENDANVYRSFYRHTGRPLKERGIAWLRLDHAGKDPKQGQRGSSAKNDDVDVVWRLERRDGNDLRLVATHRRLAWVPDSFDLKAATNDDGSIHVTDAPTYPDGTFHVVRLFDEHEIPLDWSRRKAGQWLRQQGEKYSDSAIMAALRHRKMTLDVVVTDSPVNAVEGSAPLSAPLETGDARASGAPDAKALPAPLARHARQWVDPERDGERDVVTRHPVVSELDDFGGLL